MKVEPPAEIRHAAATMFVMFTALIDAGFEREDAVYMITQMLVSQLNGE